MANFSIVTNRFNYEDEADDVNEFLERAFLGEGFGKINSIDRMKSEFEKIRGGVFAHIENQDTKESWDFGPYGEEVKGDPKEQVVIKVVTAPGSNALEIGESYSYEGVTWSDSSDRVDSDNNGRVFLTCDDQETADFVCSQMDDDDRVVSYEQE